MDVPEKEKQLSQLISRLQYCHSCELARSRNNVLPGAGNLQARLMLIAQAPGDREDSEGRLFIGPSGQVLNRLLKQAGLSWGDLFLTNLLKCRLPRSRRPKQREIEACLPYLEEEVQIIDPEILVPLGFYATRSVMLLNNLTPPQSKASSSDFFGQLFWQERRKVFPLPHPSAMLYKPSLEKGAKQLYGKLRILSRVCHWYQMCPIRRFYEKDLLDKSWIEMYCRGDWSRCVRFQKEEQGIYHPDWMLPDGSLDENLA